MSSTIAAATPAAATTREIPFEFRGSGSEYFRIWIVNLLLTIVTIGIYSAWAKVRRLRYFYGSTLLDDNSFEYHGQPLAILKGRLIAFGAYLVLAIVTQFLPLAGLAFFPLVVFGVPWIIMRSRLFQMRMSSYRGLRFNFHGTYGDALGAYIGWAILAAITLYILMPMWLWKRIRYLLGNAAYGNERFTFTTSTGVFFRFFFIAAGMFAVLGLVFLGLMAALLGKLGAAAGDPQQLLMALFSGGGLLVLLALVVLAIGIAGYYQKSLNNAAFGGLELGPHRVQSRLQSWPLVGIYVSNFVLIVLTLGLFYPWAKVRQYRYQITNMSLLAHGDLDQFTASAAEGTDAIGEEIGDFFDIDFGL